MDNGISMIKFHTIRTEPVEMVTKDCPIGIFRTAGGFRSALTSGDDRKYKYCERCEFFTKDHQCAYELYETRLIDKNSSCDDDCGYGIPLTNYGWMFKCSKCGHIIRFSSGYSVMSYGDQETCFKCKTKHRYLGKNKDEIHSFAIPTL